MTAVELTSVCAPATSQRLRDREREREREREKEKERKCCKRFFSSFKPYGALLLF